MSNKVITINEDGLTKLNADNLDEIIINVNNNVHAQLLIDYTNCKKINKEINLAANASLNLLQMNSSDDSEINEIINLAKDSQMISGYYELNDHNVKLTSRYNLNEQGASVKIISSCVTNAYNKDIDIECIHHVGHTNSDMENFAISNEGANYAIRACGTIKKGSSQAKSLQNTKVLTTSENQRSSVTPLLLIDENDVMASHANSLGAMNSDHLYYLMSRGLNRKQATGLLTLSYLLPLSSIIDDEEIKEQITNKIRNQVGL